MDKYKNIRNLLIVSTALLSIYSVTTTLKIMSLEQENKELSTDYTELVTLDRFDDRDVSGALLVTELMNSADNDFTFLVKGNNSAKYFNYGKLLKNTDSTNQVELPANPYRYYENIEKTNESNEDISRIHVDNSEEYIPMEKEYHSKLIKDSNEKVIGICFERLDN